ncbi:MAG: enoyl-CoA hydratase/isomerase family protein, partial [Acidimicrobiales bacterium]
MEFSSDVLTLAVDAHVATLWLDRPEARNALGSALWRDRPRACAAIDEDPEVRCVVVAPPPR